MIVTTNTWYQEFSNILVDPNSSIPVNVGYVAILVKIPHFFNPNTPRIGWKSVYRYYLVINQVFKHDNDNDLAIFG